MDNLEDINYFDCAIRFPKEYKNWALIYLMNKFTNFEESFLSSILNKFNNHLAPSMRYLIENMKITKQGFEFSSVDENNGKIVDFTIKPIPDRQIQPLNLEACSELFQNEVIFINKFIEAYREKRSSKAERMCRIVQWERKGNVAKICFGCNNKFFPEELICLIICYSFFFLINNPALLERLS
jgi:hypothetical protein